jgi:hypothetical protein
MTVRGRGLGYIFFCRLCGGENGDDNVGALRVFVGQMNEKSFVSRDTIFLLKLKTSLRYQNVTKL